MDWGRLYEYAKAVGAYWFAIMGTIAFVSGDLFNWLGFGEKLNKLLPRGRRRPLEIAIIIFVIFYAGFDAWNDQLASTERSEVGRQSAAQWLSTWKARAEEREVQIRSLQIALEGYRKAGAQQLEHGSRAPQETYTAGPKKRSDAEVAYGLMQMSQALSKWSDNRKQFDPAYIIENGTPKSPEQQYREQQQTLQFSSDTQAQYAKDFLPMIAVLRDEAAQRHITDSELDKNYEFPTNYFGYQQVAARLIVLANRVTEHQK